MIDPTALKSHIKDYAEVFGRNTDRFVCPITLRECEQSELINGHILNGALLNASRRRVIQYGVVDRFYGTRVESELVRYLNAKDRSFEDLLSANKNLHIEFHNGTTAKAFVTSGRSAVAAMNKFPIVDVEVNDKTFPIYVTVEFNDPRLCQPLQLVGRESFLPSHWVAGLLKAAHLTLFDLIGYKAIESALGDTLRSTLAKYFRENASRDDAPKYFADFHNSMKLLGKGRCPSDLRDNYKAFEFDTLENRMLLFHYVGSDQRLMFAATCIFNVNEATITVTIPATLTGTDVAVAWRLYQALMTDEHSVEQQVYRVQFTDNHWKIETKPLNVNYLKGPELFP